MTVPHKWRKCALKLIKFTVIKVTWHPAHAKNQSTASILSAGFCTKKAYVADGKKVWWHIKGAANNSHSLTQPNAVGWWVRARVNNPLTLTLRPSFSEEMGNIKHRLQLLSTLSQLRSKIVFGHFSKRFGQNGIGLGRDERARALYTKGYHPAVW